MPSPASDNQPLFSRMTETRAPMRRWTRVALVGSVAGHVGVAVALIVTAMWKIEKLTPDRTELTVAANPGLPPPPAEQPEPQTGGARRSVPSDAPSKAPRRVRLATGLETNLVEADYSDGGGDGSEPGPTGPGGPGGAIGDLGKTGGGCLLPPCGDPPETIVEKEEPKIVAPELVEGLRYAGEREIYPPNDVVLQMKRDGRDKLRAAIKVCLTKSGSIDSLKVIGSTGYDAYDARFLEKMADWRYHPYKLGETPVAVCTVVDFIYRLH